MGTGGEELMIWTFNPSRGRYFDAKEIEQLDREWAIADQDWKLPRLSIRKCGSSFLHQSIVPSEAKVLLKWIDWDSKDTH
ncbi:MAG: hypothetical protein ACTS5A_01545 [Candidatus Hodgkinia cicadicola]